MQQSNLGSTIASENFTHPRSTLYVEHSVKKQTATSQMSMPETRIASMCSSCITHRQKLMNIRKRLQILRVQVNQTKMETVKRLNEKIRRNDLLISRLQSKLDASIVAKRSPTLIKKKHRKY